MCTFLDCLLVKMILSFLFSSLYFLQTRIRDIEEEDELKRRAVERKMVEKISDIGGESSA